MRGDGVQEIRPTEDATSIRVKQSKEVHLQKAMDGEAHGNGKQSMEFREGTVSMGWANGGDNTVPETQGLRRREDDGRGCVKQGVTLDPVVASGFKKAAVTEYQNVKVNHPRSGRLNFLGPQMLLYRDLRRGGNSMEGSRGVKSGILGVKREEKSHGINIAGARDGSLYWRKKRSYQ